MPELSLRMEHVILASIVLAYLVLGALYATLTPSWQVPDEPAHYNYVRFLVEERRLPILRPGDYDQAYLTEATTRRFDPALSIDPIRYEYHQPPLYYLLAAPVYVAFGGALIPLRLLSVALGGCLLVVVYLVGKATFPRRQWLALGAVGLVAFIPQHVAMTAGVENDTLAELLLGTVLLALVRWLQPEVRFPTKSLLLVGLLVGLALLTKVGVYIAVPLALVAALLKFWQVGPSGTRQLHIRPALRAALTMLLPALALSVPWFVRNGIVYGGFDVTGLERHNQVVLGQLRTSEWIQRYGLANLPLAFVGTTFRSFWAQFGWMAVPIDARLYIALGLSSISVALGFVFWLLDTLESKQRISKTGVLLATSALLTVGTYLGYNLTFYQAQGRYLFPALIPIGLGWSLGLHRVLSKKDSLMIAVALAFAAGLGTAKWFLRGDANKWRILMSGLGAAALGSRRFLPDRVGDWLFVLPYLFLSALCAVSPFWFIVPHLSPSV